MTYWPYLAHAIECCDSWEPEARLIGNVPAKELGDMLRALRRAATCRECSMREKIRREAEQFEADVEEGKRILTGERGDRDPVKELADLLQKSGAKLCLCFECSHQASYGKCTKCGCKNERK